MNPFPTPAAIAAAAGAAAVGAPVEVAVGVAVGTAVIASWIYHAVNNSDSDDADTSSDDDRSWDDDGKDHTSDFSDGEKSDGVPDREIYNDDNQRIWQEPQGPFGPDVGGEPTPSPEEPPPSPEDPPPPEGKPEIPKARIIKWGDPPSFVGGNVSQGNDGQSNSGTQTVKPADTNGDGVVTDDEEAAWMMSQQ